ncbi:hypothetical protein BpHYR1_035718 [Brachionus plicatilis]|uniref:Uncharacterized protein n=1 Tax=Brachionus plicatilis TaxID=10195 RepID=A0A3M7Q1H0_BRAPC|nr:hypothetical protein BpHYR1_035718 [Brachionus plicatilis]
MTNGLKLYHLVKRKYKCAIKKTFTAVSGGPPISPFNSKKQITSSLVTTSRNSLFILALAILAIFFGKMVMNIFCKNYFTFSSTTHQVSSFNKKIYPSEYQRVNGRRRIVYCKNLFFIEICKNKIICPFSLADNMDGFDLTQRLLKLIPWGFFWFLLGPFWFFLVLFGSLWFFMVLLRFFLVNGVRGGALNDTEVLFHDKHNIKNLTYWLFALELFANLIKNCRN